MSTTQKFLLRPAQNSAVYPSDAADSASMLAWRKGDAAQAALNANGVAQADYLNHFNNTWLPQYYAGRDIPYDADPPVPPVEKWASATATFDDNGGLGFTYDLVNSPLGNRVCDVPSFKRMPKPQGGTVSLMGLLSSEGGASGVPTIATVAVGEESKDSAGNTWVRTA